MPDASLSAEAGVRRTEIGFTSVDAQPGKVLRILLAEDHAMVREGLRSILDAYPDISIVGEAADGEEAMELAGLLAPDVVVMDINMPKMDGIEATRRIKARWPDMIVIGLSLSARHQVEPLLLQAGAGGYVSKAAAGDQLYEAIVAAVSRAAARCSAENNRAVSSHDEC